MGRLGAARRLTADNRIPDSIVDLPVTGNPYTHRLRLRLSLNCRKPAGASGAPRGMPAGARSSLISEATREHPGTGEGPEWPAQPVRGVSARAQPPHDPGAALGAGGGAEPGGALRRRESLLEFVRQRRKGKRVSRATLYRTLEHLRAAGLVKMHRFGPGQALYEHVYSRRHHDHMVCDRCGRVIEFVTRRSSGSRTRSAASTAFAPAITSCRSSESARSAPRKERRVGRQR